MEGNHVSARSGVSKGAYPLLFGQYFDKPPSGSFFGEWALSKRFCQVKWKLATVLLLAV
jgi:hypothetical protein